ncbi:MAG: tRNA (adenosine(37)-N6)-threonylcarbamoyltransferase complex transferase subunit TsaD [Candidatus Abyssobacteria bacterium SURF_17]|uniref:tRNA N6-adenosine threonylcarbamoyltransferase n=1 Tax=Candidatus Abyssobacteria bacterium SURF_17 TaxID=2093361 RepID=A0A419F7N4_9BACT|nr:MAG: tRNA (adenosine(37)-N6)-threonylcarbamoyltransferase complex transferase subunit TsaD [Candidatus Abyssubacteria bacterium SURF_17]
MLVLGIETSCDETGVAIVESGTHILANQVASQIPLHERFGGVVPEIASRAHLRVITPMLRAALEKAGCSLGQIDIIAVTVGPGLVGSLLVGISFAKALAYVTGKPLVPVHHLEGHIYANIVAGASLRFPFVALVASGGHTDLIECRGPLQYRILGRTRDDAAGEAFDKVAKLLNLDYPGGPAIERIAAHGNPRAFDFPRPMLSEPGFDFSFSGLKTAVLYCQAELKERSDFVELVPDVAASFQAAVADVLAEKARRAVRETGVSNLALGGGVIANRCIRETIVSKAGCDVFVPPPELCLDNGAMTASVGYYRHRSGYYADKTLNAEPNLRLSSSLWKELKHE